ncbi:MAG TPA: hypothetical protein VJC16_01320 [Candidatus Nanoarchaeia archaeon]|nr:hypothetical protein [Candidatus Nanoarchaeia archaeon]
MGVRLLQVDRSGEETVIEKSLADLLTGDTPCGVTRTFAHGNETLTRSFAINYRGLLAPYDSALFWTFMADSEETGLFCPIFPGEREVIVVPHAQERFPHFRGMGKLLMGHNHYHYSGSMIDALMQFQEAGYQIHLGRRALLDERVRLSSQTISRERAEHVITLADVTGQQLEQLFAAVYRNP